MTRRFLARLRLAARLLLLAVALLLPAQAAAEVPSSAHCQSHAGAAGVMDHAVDHGAMGHRDGTSAPVAAPAVAPADESCPHCPAASCAVMTTCSTSVPVRLVPAMPTLEYRHADWSPSPVNPDMLFGSLPHEPPTRPPLRLL